MNGVYDPKINQVSALDQSQGSYTLSWMRTRCNVATVVKGTYRPRERASTTSSAAGSDVGSRSELATTCS